MYDDAKGLERKSPEQMAKVRERTRARENDLLILATWAVSYPLWAEGRYSLPAQPFVAIGIAAMLIRLRRPAPRGVSSRARIVQIAPK